MAKEIYLSNGTVALFDDNATDDEINKKLKDNGLTRGTAPASPTATAPAGPATDLPANSRPNLAVPPGMGPVAPFIGSAVNSLLFGLPEMGARSLGAGPFIESVRRDYPVATTAGDVAGMLPPFKRLAEMGQRAVGSMFKPAARNPEDVWRVMQQSDETNRAAQAIAQAAGPYAQMAQRGAQRVGGLGTGIMGAQTQAAALGAARSPENPGAGAQQGAQVFRQTAMNMPGTQLIPGAQSTIGAVTGVVPGVLGLGAAMTDYLSINDMIRQEAAKRALQGPR
jgi:hypothetical protein